MAFGSGFSIGFRVWESTNSAMPKVSPLCHLRLRRGGGGGGDELGLGFRV